jgi:hypothetical protein
MLLRGRLGFDSPGTGCTYMDGLAIAWTVGYRTCVPGILYLAHRNSYNDEIYEIYK